MEDGKIISYQRDRFVETSELTLPFLDDVGGTIRGYRVFTACRTVRDKIFRIEDHLDRLYYSAASMYMDPPLPRNRLQELLTQVVRVNREAGHGGDLLIDVVFSGGLAGNCMKQSGNGAFLYIAVQPMEPPPAEAYVKGVALATFVHQRLCPDVKLLNYIGAVLAHQTVVPQYDAWDVLFINPIDQQTVLEGSTFTVFFVNFQGELLTPPLNGKILESVTRRVVLEICEQTEHLAVREAPVTLGEVISFPEAFLVSTTRNVLPVTRLDDQIIGSGKPGPVTQSLMAAFRRYLEAY
jgi:branched-chain amino acid aminotransferase